MQSLAEGSEVTLADVAADPQCCWAAGEGPTGGGAVWVLSAGNTLTALATPIGEAFDVASTILPIVRLDEVRDQKAATSFWVGGGNGAPIRRYFLPPASTTAQRDPLSLPLSSDFEMKFIKN